ncbi:YchJ family protein [Vibrio sp. S9_S30]|uniref:YchJ family protein n=1 Tax=Vibrio sp. S9_S30 TaxID=2720226 RepID=UPI001680E994|nr:YchJ family protein [Vibrio sp. S9_S30]MBD1557884.1 YchJ family protein [Vibrio sp. S9_S30]
MSHCPCGNPQPYQDCCEIVHLNHAAAAQPEMLMRARYSAHVKGLVDFVVNTYHPSKKANEQREDIARSVNSDWCKLDVINTESGSHADEGYVEFKAYFNEDNKQYCLGERSRFLRENGVWYYIDGIFPEETQPMEDPRLSQPVTNLKVGRNDPCICGSGKKFKKCCG